MRCLIMLLPFDIVAIAHSRYTRGWVILSGAKDLARNRQRFFAALRMIRS